MAALTLDELIERARLESGLRNNAYYDSDQIIRYLNAGGSELYDIFTAANQHYVISQHDFTTTGQSDAVVDLPDDFQQGHSLEIYPDLPGQTRTIRYLSNWLNRNTFGNIYALAPGGFDPVYTFLDNKLRFYPPQCTPAAPFRLYYTPMWTTLAQPVTQTIEIDGANDNLVAPTSIPSFVSAGALAAWTFANADLTDVPTDGTALLTVNLDAPNDVFNGTYPILASIVPPASSFPEIGTALPADSTGWTGPEAGTASITYQAAGTRNTLPAYMASWSEYVVVYAAIAINTDRQRGTGELERKLNALKVRINSIISARQEEPQQPPLTRGWGDGGGWGPNGGFGFGGSW